MVESHEWLQILGGITAFFVTLLLLLASPNLLSCSVVSVGTEVWVMAGRKGNDEQLERWSGNFEG